MIEEGAAIHTGLAWCVAILLFLVFAYAEIRRGSLSRRAGIRILLLLPAIGGLLGLALKPTYQAAGGDTTIILNGATEEQLDSLLRQYPAAPVYSLQPHRDYPLMEGMSYLPRYAASGNKIIFAGRGLAAQELKYLKDYQLSYVPAASAGGVTAIDYTRNLSLSDTLVVQGTWYPQATAGKLLLSLGSIAMDSVVAAKGGRADFRLKTPNRLAGSILYRLFWLSPQGDTLAAYALPVNVPEPEALQLALLTAYPEPESKYLKEQLMQQGHKLYYSARLAPGKEVKEWINLPRDLFIFNKRGLSAWDVLILSAGFYSELGGNSWQELSTAVRHQGLGLLLYPDVESNGVNWQGSRIQFVQEEVRDTLMVRGIKLPLTYRPLRQVPPGWQVLIRGTKGVVAISRRHGLGQVVVSSSVLSYRLVLMGQEQAYQQYWHRLITEALPLEARETQWKLPLSSAKHLPIQLGLYSTDSLPGLQILDPDQQMVKVPVWQSESVPNFWQLKFWPRQKGWYKAIARGDTAVFRVEDTASSILEAQREQQLRHLQAKQELPGIAASAFTEKPVSPWLFYLIFIIGMGGLWLEKKLYG